MQVIVDGMLTHYTRAGNGPVVLILPGWADSSKSWVGIQNKLAADYDVLVLDLPGFGDSQAPASAWGLSEYALFIGAWLQKIDAGELHAVIGHSNGGALSLRAIARKNITPDRLVLLASAGIRSTYQGRKRALRLIAKTGKVIIMPLPASIKQRLRKRAYTSIGSDMMVAEHMQDTFKKIVGDDVQADAAKVDIPTLLIYGDNDDQTPPVYGQTFHQLLHGSTFEIIEGAGHFIHLEQPDKVVTHIRKFLPA